MNFFKDREGDIWREEEGGELEMWFIPAKDNPIHKKPLWLSQAFIALPFTRYSSNEFTPITKEEAFIEIL